MVEHAMGTLYYITFGGADFFREADQSYQTTVGAIR